VISRARLWKESAKKSPGKAAAIRLAAALRNLSGAIPMNRLAAMQ
jgi:hypothetical protein